MITTPRLRLRRWEQPDLDPFAEICADEQVMEFFPAPLTRKQSNDFIARVDRHFDEHGYGFWAVESLEGPRLIGFVGLAQVAFAADFVPAVEIGWRLARSAWGQGYASEAGRAALGYAFETLGLCEIVSFTVPENARSRAVMERLGLKRNPREDFDHPTLGARHPLARHVLYRLAASDWSGSSQRDEAV